MKVALTAALACASFAVAAVSRPAAQSRTDPIRIAVQRGGRFVFTQGQRKTVLNVRNSISGCISQNLDIYGVRVLDEVAKGGFQYVVMQVSAFPNCDVNGVCGVSLNNDVLWFKFDSRLNLVSQQAENVENCRGHRSLITDSPFPDLTVFLNMQAGVLLLHMEDTDYPTITRRAVLRYDRQVPERGLVVSESK